MKSTKYTKDLLCEAVKNSQCISDVCRYINGNNIKHIHGGVHNHIAKKIKEYEIDTSHFLTAGELGLKRGALGTKGISPTNKRTAAELLVKNRPFVAHAHQIRRALIEAGKEYKCNECGNKGTWNNKELTLEIHHRNGDKTDDTSENLIFLCPNCHTQTNNYKIKNRKEGLTPSAAGTALEKQGPSE